METTMMNQHALSLGILTIILIDWLKIRLFVLLGRAQFVKFDLNASFEPENFIPNFTIITLRVKDGLRELKNQCRRIQADHKRS